MAEVGRINPEKKIACPHCRALLPDFPVEDIAEGKKLRCPKCKERIKLPDAVVERAKQQRYLGRGLDITC